MGWLSRSFEHRFETVVDRTADECWISATTLSGIVAELPGPLRLRTSPPVASLDDVLAVANAPVVATLSLGRVPVLRWTPGIERLDVARRTFVESSTDMTMMRAWRHERRIVDLGVGRCRVEDRVSGASRVPGSGVLVQWMFGMRHRNIAKH